MIKLPTWLKDYLEEQGLEQGPFTFVTPGQTLPVAGIPDGFVAVAEDEGEGSLMVAKESDQILYYFKDGEIQTYALDLSEFLLHLRRDETWAELSENMPASQRALLAVMIKARKDDGKWLVMGFPSKSRPSAMMIQAEIKSEELLVDALQRELQRGLGLPFVDIIDVVDEGSEDEGGEEGILPVFTVIVETEWFPPSHLTPDKQVGWVAADKVREIKKN